MLTERKPKGDYSTVSVFLMVSHTAGKTTMHTSSLMNGVSSCLVCEYALSVSLQPKLSSNFDSCKRIHRRKTKHVPEGGPQTCRAKDVGDVSCLLTLGKVVEGSVEVLGTKCPREIGGMRGPESISLILIGRGVRRCVKQCPRMAWHDCRRHESMHLMPVKLRGMRA
jgi:hypothetical protein